MKRTHCELNNVCSLTGTCCFVGCTNAVVNNRVCIRHGATVKKCSNKDCSNNAVQGGVCITHGARVYTKKKCSSEGCERKSRVGGVCYIHRKITNNVDNSNTSHITASSESAHMISMPPCDNAVTNKGCDDLNDDIMHMNVITITSTEGGREVNLRILSL